MLQPINRGAIHNTSLGADTQFARFSTLWGDLLECHKSLADFVVRGNMTAFVQTVHDEIFDVGKQIF